MNNKIKELKTYFFKYSFPHLLLYRVGESCFYIFIIYLLGFLNSVPLLKNLPTDKLARIADCLEVVGITRTLNFCANNDPTRLFLLYQDYQDYQDYILPLYVFHLKDYLKKISCTIHADGFVCDQYNTCISVSGI